MILHDDGGAMCDACSMIDGRQQKEKIIERTFIFFYDTRRHNNDNKNKST